MTTLAQIEKPIFGTKVTKKAGKGKNYTLNKIVSKFKM
jgi:hypothetical protein